MLLLRRMRSWPLATPAGTSMTIESSAHDTTLAPVISVEPIQRRPCASPKPKSRSTSLRFEPPPTVPSTRSASGSGTLTVPIDQIVRRRFEVETYGPALFAAEAWRTTGVPLGYSQSSCQLPGPTNAAIGRTGVSRYVVWPGLKSSV